MTAPAWAYSPAYRVPVVLGPVQADVYALVLELTAGGRRAELTVREIGARIGRAASSVHVALRRLRALGLIGMKAEPGRCGGHRFWRETRRSGRQLTRPRQLVARLVGLRRFMTADRPSDRSLWAEPEPDTPAEPTTTPSGDSARGLDPFGVVPMIPPYPGPAEPAAGPPGERLIDKLRRYGLRDDLAADLERPGRTRQPRK